MACESEVALVQKLRERERERGKIKEKKSQNIKMGTCEWEENLFGRKIYLTERDHKCFHIQTVINLFKHLKTCIF